VAALRQGLVDGARDTRLLVLGSGQDEDKLRRYAEELGISDAVEIRGGVPYDAMPEFYARSTCVVLASLQRPGWEEQFGMVLAEALAAGVPIVASSSGAIPEVLGSLARLFVPGDWLGLARRLAEVRALPATHIVADHSRVESYSATAAAERIALAYERLLSP
jgi:glycosyltransferase involved in cell wall biosynthesis